MTYARGRHAWLPRRAGKSEKIMNRAMDQSVMLGESISRNIAISGCSSSRLVRHCSQTLTEGTIDPLGTFTGHL